MQRYIYNIHKNRGAIAALSGALILILLLLVRVFVYQEGPLAKGTPDLRPIYLLSTTCIVVALVLIYFSFLNLKNCPISIFSNNNSMQRAILLLCICLSITLSLTLLYNTNQFNLISYEDQLIEWLSFYLLAAGAVFFIVCFMQCIKHKSLYQLRLPILFFACLYGLIAMEEVSWMTRVLEIDTPALFNANDQYEINLHNFFTSYSENLYYVGTHLYFVVIPIIALSLGVQNQSTILKVFLSKPHLLLIAMIASAYNYNMWNSIFIQLSFFSSVMALLLLYFKNNKPNERKGLLLFLGFLLITQVLYLSSGEHYLRLHEITEYKEMFIALTLFIYATDVFQEINQQAAKAKLRRSDVSNAKTS